MDERARLCLSQLGRRRRLQKQTHGGESLSLRFCTRTHNCLVRFSRLKVQPSAVSVTFRGLNHYTRETIKATMSSQRQVYTLLLNHKQVEIPLCDTLAFILNPKGFTKKITLENCGLSAIFSLFCQANFKVYASFPCDRLSFPQKR